MPQTLILFHSRTGATAALADSIAEGARSVRFSEVTVRRIDDASLAGYQTLGHIEELASYDGIILGGPAIDGVVCPEVMAVLDQARALKAGGAFANTVGSAFCAEPGAVAESMLLSLGGLGMILVPPADGATGAALGKRVAEVVSWVTHARSHAHSHTHAH